MKSTTLAPSIPGRQSPIVLDMNPAGTACGGRRPIADGWRPLVTSALALPARILVGSDVRLVETILQPFDNVNVYWPANFPL